MGLNSTEIPSLVEDWVQRGQGMHVLYACACVCVCVCVCV